MLKKRLPFSLLFLLFLPLNMLAQATDTSVAAIIRTEQNLKTGNALDVLTSFFQVALKDLSGADKSFGFKSTLFAMKVGADSSLLIDTNFRRQQFARNLQFEVALRANDHFKPVGMSGGITYALVNNRDKKSADFRNTPFEQALSDYASAKETAETDFEDQLRDSLNMLLPLLETCNKKIQLLTDSLLAATQADQRERLRDHLTLLQQQKHELEENKTELLSRQSMLNAIINGQSVPGAALQEAYEQAGLSGLRQTADSLYEAQMLDIASRGLLALKLEARTDSNTSRFNEGNIHLTYLKGFSNRRRIEADLRGGLQVKDTLTPNGAYRVSFQLTGGANFILFQGRQSHKSVLEIKPNLEFSGLLSRKYPEQRNYFYLNVDIRLRITDEIWIPVIVKYDVQNQNFLGFLNVSANLKALSGLIPGRPTQ